MNKQKHNWTKNEEGAGMMNRMLPATTRREMSAFSPSSLMNPMSFFSDMESALRNFGLPTFGSMQHNMQSMMQTMMPPSVDITSTDKEYSIEMEVPGIDEKDIRIDLKKDGQLIICGEKKVENENQEKDFHRMERSYGSFQRTLSLPEDVDGENVTASFKNGVLSISIPRTQSAETNTRRVEVNADNQRDKNRGGARQESGASNTNNPSTTKRVA
jgi:HSP20 family protein